MTTVVIGPLGVYDLEDQIIRMKTDLNDSQYRRTTRPLGSDVPSVEEVGDGEYQSIRCGRSRRFGHQDEDGLETPVRVGVRKDPSCVCRLIPVGTEDRLSPGI